MLGWRGENFPGDHMPKKILILACALLLGGCALPVPLQIASWAVDGLIFITTEKTVSDHGISLALQRDCAMLRVITEGDLCRESDPVVEVATLTPPLNSEDTAPVHDVIVAAVGEGTANTDVGGVVGDNDIAERLAAFATAAGTIETTTVEVSDTALLEQYWQDWTEAPFEEALLIETSSSEARWQAIVDAPSNHVQPIDHNTLKSLTKFSPEPKPERTAEQTEYVTELKFLEAPEMIGGLLDFIRGDDGLYFGDTSLDPVLNGNDAITILGGTGNDLLFDGTLDARGPTRTQTFPRSSERQIHTQKLPPPGNISSARAKDPPGGSTMCIAAPTIDGNRIA